MSPPSTGRSSRNRSAARVKRLATYIIPVILYSDERKIDDRNILSRATAHLHLKKLTAASFAMSHKNATLTTQLMLWMVAQSTKRCRLLQ